MSLHFPFSYLLPILLFILFILKWRNNSNRKNNQLPSPPKLPIIGNFHQIGSHPHRSFYSLSKKYGEVMLLHFGSKPTIVVSSTRAVLEILKTHDLIFSNRPNSTLKNKLVYGSGDVAFATVSKGWRQRKSIMMLQLLTNKRVTALRSIREEETKIMLEKIETSCSSHKVVNLSKMFLALTNNTMCRVAMGSKYRNEEVQGMQFQDFLSNFGVLLAVIDVGNYIPWLRWINHLSGLYRKANRVAKEFDGFLENVLEDHLRSEQNNCDDTKDFVDVLLEYQRENRSGYSFSREDIKAIILNVFVGGTSTTFVALEWAITELIRHPMALKNLQNEVRNVVKGKQMVTEDDLKKMQYLKAVIKEALRLHPPSPLLVPRETTKDVEFMGYDIKAGTHAHVNVYAINRDPLAWNEPDVFRPERFLGNGLDYKGHDLQFIPFGAGRRTCPAIEFAIRIEELAVANLVQKFNFELPDGIGIEDLDMNETTGITNLVQKFNFELPDGIGIEDLDMNETTGITKHRKVPLYVVPSLAHKE